MRENQEVTCKVTFIQIVGNFSTETKNWNAQKGAFQVLKDHSCPPILLYPAKLPAKTEDRTTVPDKIRLKKLINSKSCLQKILEGILGTKENDTEGYKRNKSV